MEAAGALVASGTDRPSSGVVLVVKIIGAQRVTTWQIPHGEAPASVKGWALGRMFASAAALASAKYRARPQRRWSPAAAVLRIGRQYVANRVQDVLGLTTLQPSGQFGLFFGSFVMHFNANHTHKFASLLAATLITLALHGSLLAGFDRLAAQSANAVFANCNSTTLPPVTVLGRRG